MPRISTNLQDDAFPVPVRRWLIPIVSVLAVLAGGVAAAQIGGGEDPVGSEPVPTTLVTTTTTPDDGGATDGTDPREDEGSTGVERYWGEECGEGPATNHGQYVASADKSGQSRREAAHSPCGKPAHTVTTTTVASEEEDEEEEGDEPTVESSGSTKPGHGRGGGPPPGKGGPKHN